MPFRSEAQRKFLEANHPEIAKRWAAETPAGAKLPERNEKPKRAAKRKKAAKPLEPDRSRYR